MDSDVARYLRNRDAFRAKASEDFHASNPDYADLLDATDEYVAHVVYNLSGKTIVVSEFDRYLNYLLVTFARGHFNVSQFTRSGELIEAGALFRRQMEVLARINEARNRPDLERLLRKTPNVGSLRGSIKRLYGQYSAIAHGSDTCQMELLGTPFSEAFERSLPVFPRFSRHAYVLVGHVAFSIVELHAWLEEHAEGLGWPHDEEWFDEWWNEHAPEMARLLQEDPYDSPYASA